MFSKLSGTGAIALMMGSLLSVEGQNQNRPMRYDALETSDDFGMAYRDGINLLPTENQKRKAISELSCNICIKAGYTYMYEYFGDHIISSEYFTDLNVHQGKMHQGACCTKRPNGSLLCEKWELKPNKPEKADVNFQNYDVTQMKSVDRPLSSAFDNKKVAIAACPTKQTVCGKKRHFLYDHMSEPVSFSVHFGPETEEGTEVLGGGTMKHFENKKDECHWLIQTKCGVPLIKTTVNMPKVHEYVEQMEPKFFKEFEFLEEYRLFMPEVEEKEVNADDKITLSYIEYNPQITEDFSDEIIQYFGDYPYFDADPFFVKANFAREPSEYPEVRQYVKKPNAKTGQPVELTGNEKSRMFPASLITDNLLTYQRYLNRYDMMVKENNMKIEEYNKVVNEFDIALKRFKRFEALFIEEDNARIEAEREAGNENPRPAGRMRPEGIIPPVPSEQQTPAFIEYNLAFDNAVNFFNENIKDKLERPEWLDGYRDYEGFNFGQFEPVYGFGLPTAGTISLDHFNYGRYKSFGVLGQQGMNYKTYRDRIEDYFDASEALLQGFGEEIDEQIKMEAEEAIDKGFRDRPMRHGQKIGDPDSCSSSFVLLSLTPNTINDGDWNSNPIDSQGSKLTIEVTAQKTNDRKPLTPEFLKFPTDQLNINPLVLVRPGTTIQSEDAASFVKAAAATATAAVALYLF